MVQLLKPLINIYKWVQHVGLTKHRRDLHTLQSSGRLQNVNIIFVKDNNNSYWYGTAVQEIRNDEDRKVLI